MADNPFDPADPKANETAADLPTGKPVKRTSQPFIDRPKMVPAPPMHPGYAGIEDRRLQDFGDWGPGRYLDPATFQNRVNEAWRLPAGSYLSSEAGPIGPSTPLGRQLGTTNLDQGLAAMAALREGLRKKAAGRQ